MSDLDSSFHLLWGIMNMSNLQSTGPVLKGTLYINGCQGSLCKKLVLEKVEHGEHLRLQQRKSRLGHCQTPGSDV